MVKKTTKHTSSAKSAGCNCMDLTPVLLIGGILLLAILATNVQMNGKLDSLMGGTVVKGDSGTQPTAPSPTPTAAEVVDVKHDGDPRMGRASAKVEIIEFSDFQCPFCARFYSQTMGQIKSEYIDTGKASLVFRDFPLSFHAEAQKASEAAECANEQGKFWEYHDHIFENQAALSGGVSVLKTWAGELGLDQSKFDSCLDTGKYEAEVKKDFADGQAAGVSGTPTLFINGKKIVGAHPFATFKAAIDAELAK